MSKEECMDALSKYADIKPVITSTVWKELEKENKEFFEAYAKRREERGAAAASSSSETHRSQRIHDLLFHSNSNKNDNTSTTIN
ncbi:argininosuccinate lyase [Perilla frutescens var. frutescens]|nr:argininosuccinate lyase [Perilla frutescens var. frutescens]